jgi:AAHS family benzoate transporter-like MFS transporter
VPLLCWLTLVVDGYDVIIFGSTVPAIIKDPQWGATTQSVALVGSLMLVGVAVGALSSGLVTDVLGRRKLFLISLTLFSVGALGCALAPNFTVFGFWRVLSGLGIGAILPTAVALTVEFAKPEIRSRTVGLLMTGIAVGGLVGSFVTLQLLEKIGFRSIYALGAIALVTILPVAAWRLPESAVYLRSRGRVAEADRIAAMYRVDPAESVRPTGRVPIGKLFEGRSRWVTPGLWVAMFTSQLLTLTLITWLPQLLIAGGMELQEALRYFVFFNIAAIVATAVWSFLADRIGSKMVITIGFLGAAVGFVMIAVGDKTWVGTGVWVTGFGTGSALSYLLDHIAGYYRPDVRPSGLGWASGAGRLGAIAAPSYGGFIISVSAGSVSLLAWALAVPAAAGALLMMALPREGANRMPSGSGPTTGTPSEPGPFLNSQEHRPETNEIRN